MFSLSSKSDVDVDDFVAGTRTTVIFNPGETNKCVNFEIVNDNIVEQPPIEEFTVAIDEISPDSIGSERPTAKVAIIDDDSRCYTTVKAQL